MRFSWIRPQEVDFWKGKWLLLDNTEIMVQWARGESTGDLLFGPMWLEFFCTRFPDFLVSGRPNNGHRGKILESSGFLPPVSWQEINTLWVQRLEKPLWSKGLRWNWDKKDAWKFPEMELATGKAGRESGWDKDVEAEEGKACWSQQPDKPPWSKVKVAEI